MPSATRRDGILGASHLSGWYLFQRDSPRPRATAALDVRPPRARRRHDGREALRRARSTRPLQIAWVDGRTALRRGTATRSTIPFEVARPAADEPRRSRRELADCRGRSASRHSDGSALIPRRADLDGAVRASPTSLRTRRVNPARARPASTASLPPAADRTSPRQAEVRHPASTATARCATITSDPRAAAAAAQPPGQGLREAAPSSTCDSTRCHAHRATGTRMGGAAGRRRPRLRRARTACQEVETVEILKALLL